MTGGEWRPGGCPLASAAGGVAPETADLSGAAERIAADEECPSRVSDLHDAVSQALFATVMTAEVLPDLWELDPEEGRRALQDLIRLTRGALDAMRAVLAESRPSRPMLVAPPSWSGTCDAGAERPPPGM